MNPLHEPEMTAIRAANAMMGTDPTVVLGSWQTATQAKQLPAVKVVVVAVVVVVVAAKAPMRHRSH